MRRVYVLGVLAVVALTAMAFAPPAVRVRVEIVTAGADTTLRVIASWGYRTAPATGVPDSTRLRHGVGPVSSPAIGTKFVRWPKAADTTNVPVTGYGTLTGYVCIAPVRRGIIGADVCPTWSFVRPDASPPPFDTTVVKVVLRPPGLQVDRAADTRCDNWQDLHPGQTPWVQVNVQAVADCTGGYGHPMLAQFCAITVGRSGHGYLAKNHLSGPSDLVAYCRAELLAWRREVGA